MKLLQNDHHTRSHPYPPPQKKKNKKKTKKKKKKKPQTTKGTFKGAIELKQAFKEEVKLDETKW